MEEFDSVIELYEKGLLTRGELENKLIGLAATIHPEDYVPRLPPDLRRAIRDSLCVRSPPVTPEQIFLLSGVCYKPGIDEAAAAARERRQAFDAAQALNKYFAENGE